MKKNKTIQVALLMMSLIAYPASASMSGADASSNGLTMQQQPSLCKGVVVDTSGEPLMGASIVVKGTTNGTVTGIDGNFNLSGVRQPSRNFIHRVHAKGNYMEWFSNKSRTHRRQ